MKKLKMIKETGKGISGIIGGTFSLTVSTIIVKLLGLIYKIPLAGLLGDEGMGYFNSAYTVYTFFFLLCTAGVPKAVMILVSEAKAKGSVIDENNIVRVASRLFLLVGIVICAIFMLFSIPLAKLIGNSRSATTMLCIAPSIVLISLAGVIRGYLSANMRLLDIAVSQIIEGVGKLVTGLALAIWATRLGFDLEIVSALTILGVSFGAFLGLAYLLVISKIGIKREKTGQNYEKANLGLIIGRILSISLPITASAAVMSLTNIIDLGLIMRSLISVGYTESEAGSLYGNYTTLAVPMLNLALAILTPISIAHLPLFTKAYVGADIKEELAAEDSALRLTAFIGAPIMIGLTVYSKEILDFLFVNSETNVGSLLLCLLSPAIYFSSLLLVINTELESRGKVKAPVISMLFGSVAKIAVSYILIRTPEIGISGAPIGTVVSYAVALFVSVIIYQRECKRSIGILSKTISSHLYAGAAVAISRPIYNIVVHKFGNFYALIIAIIVCTVIYLSFSTFSGFLRSNNVKKMANYTNFKV